MDPTQEKLSKVTVRMAIAWGVLFSLQTLGTCIMVGLTNVAWTELKAQSKFILVVGIFVNWSGTLMAYVSKTVARLEAGKEPPTNGTDIFVKAADGTITKDKT